MTATTAEPNEKAPESKKKRVPGMEKLQEMKAEAEKSLDKAKAAAKASVDEARKHKDEIDRLIKIRELAESRKARKRRNHVLYLMIGQIVADCRKDDAYWQKIFETSVYDKEWADEAVMLVQQEEKPSKSLKEAIAEVEALQKDPNRKSYATFNEALAAMEAEDDGEEGGK